MQRIGFRAASLGLSLALLFTAAEFSLRLATRHDADGNMTVGPLRLLPFRLPAQSQRARVQRYREGGSSYLQYDPDVGWSVRPNSRSANGLYISNAAGVRTSHSRRRTPRRPEPGVLRIAVFGDSFAHGDDVPYAATWGAMLEQMLRARGIPAEVLNLGGSGYGIDQALLRWRSQGRQLGPQLVILGLQMSDVRRNLNLFRVLYNSDTGILFSKPRFVLDGYGLRLVNAPALPPEKIADTFDHFEEWPLHRHEFFYRHGNHRDRPIYASRALAFLASGLRTRFSQRRPRYDYFGEGSEARELAGRIIASFEREVRATGARFMLVHLPTARRLRQLRSGRDLEYRGFLKVLGQRFELVDPASALVRAADATSLEPLFARSGGHYSPLSNATVSGVLVQRLVPQWAARALATPGGQHSIRARAPAGARSEG